MIRRSSIVVVVVILVLSVVIAWQFVGSVWSSIQLSFADEQTEIFAEMAAKAAESLRQSPPGVHDAIGYLRYTHDYYPSNTKQTSGSRLDRIVERSRTLAELQIIQMLHEATGKDLGSDADTWIHEFTDEPVAQQ
jgi:type II secretory pathway pseudopilin PulG